MKKIFSVLLIVVSLAGLCFARGRTDSSDVVSGYINWYGNEPFAYPGLVTEDGRVFTITVAEGEKFTLNDITALQGNLIELKGKIDNSQPVGFEVLKDGIFVVKKYKVVNKK